jgi:SNF2 family DNA or RNA helicase
MYSCGMNLENTTDIIFVHNMDPQREKQVIGRAHRYGRKNALSIWYIDYVE